MRDRAGQRVDVDRPRRDPGVGEAVVVGANEEPVTPSVTSSFIGGPSLQTIGWPNAIAS